METDKILEKYAPQFVSLDKYEREATDKPWEVKHRSTLSADKGPYYEESFLGWDFTGENIPEEPGRGRFVRGADAHFVTEARNQTRALLDAYAQTLLKLAEQEWQPIETAPEITAFTKIGPQLDLWSKSDGHVPNCFFDGALNVWMQRICYMGSDGQRMTQFQEVRNPTHWRPRPAPPKQEEAM